MCFNFLIGIDNLNVKLYMWLKFNIIYLFVSYIVVLWNYYLES